MVYLYLPPAGGLIPELGATATSTSSGATMSVTMPTAANGDLLLMIVGFWDTWSVTPSGWTQIQRRSVSTGGGIAAFWRIADGTEGTPSLTGFSTGTPCPTAFVAAIPNGTAINTSAVGGSGTGSSSQSTPAVTTTTAPVLLFRAAYYEQFGSTGTNYTWPAGTTAITTVTGPNVTSYYGKLGIAYSVADPAGSQPAVTATAPDSGTYGTLTIAVA